MDNIFTRQIERRRYLGAARLFLTALFFHNFVAIKPQLHTRIGVDCIVYAPVVRAKAPEHSAVCGIDNCVTVKRGNIALPKINPVLNGCEIFIIGNAFL